MIFLEVLIFMTFIPIVSERKSNAGAIAGGVIGGIVFLILVGVGIFFYLRWMSKLRFIYYTHLFL